MPIQYLLMRRETYVIILMFILGMAGAFYLGSYTTQQTIDIASQRIYNQGVTAGMSKMQAQCDSEVASLARNCKEWYNIDMRFQNIDLRAISLE